MSSYWRGIVERRKDVLNSIDAQIEELERKRAQHVILLREASLRANGVKPCKACKRLVESPCNDMEGFQQHGPWDYSCKEILYGKPKID